MLIHNLVFQVAFGTLDSEALLIPATAYAPTLVAIGLKKDTFLKTETIPLRHIRLVE